MFNTLVPSEDKKIQEYILLVVNFPILQLIGSLQIAHTMVKPHFASGGTEIFEGLASWKFPKCPHLTALNHLQPSCSDVTVP